jgi:hypothetical protein
MKRENMSDKDGIFENARNGKRKAIKRCEPVSSVIKQYNNAN